MARIMIVSAAGIHGGKLALVAAVLKARGHDVTLVCEEARPPQPKPLELVFRALEPIHDCKPDIEWRRERDYPTLREGIRRKQIKSLQKGRRQ